jgi:hypothetical protein
LSAWFDSSLLSFGGLMQLDALGLRAVGTAVARLRMM